MKRTLSARGVLKALKDQRGELHCINYHGHVSVCLFVPPATYPAISVPVAEGALRFGTEFDLFKLHGDPEHLVAVWVSNPVDPFKAIREWVSEWDIDALKLPDKLVDKKG